MTKVKIEVNSGSHESGFEGDAIIGAIRLSGGDIHAVISGMTTAKEDVKLFTEMMLRYYEILGLETGDEVLRAAYKTARRTHLEKHIARLQKELDKELGR